MPLSWIIITALVPVSANPDRMPIPSSSRGIGTMRKPSRPSFARKWPTTALSVLEGRCRSQRGASASMPAITAALRSSTPVGLSIALLRPWLVQPCNPSAGRT